jgi:hypothetical protein
MQEHGKRLSRNPAKILGRLRQLRGTRLFPKGFLRNKEPHETYDDEEDSEQRSPGPRSFRAKLKVFVGDPASQTDHKKGQR